MFAMMLNQSVACRGIALIITLGSLGFCGLAGCKAGCQKESSSQRTVYTFTVEEGADKLVGVGAVHVGEKIGNSFYPTYLLDGNLGHRASLHADGLIPIAGRDDISLTVPSPCGGWKLSLTPLTAKEVEKRRQSALIDPELLESGHEIDVPVRFESYPDGMPSTHTIWFDTTYLREGANTLSIGSLEITEEMTKVFGKVVLHGLNCADEHEVRINGEVVATIKTEELNVGKYGAQTDPENWGFFISFDSEKCYSYRTINYGDAVASGPPTFMEGEHVYSFQSSRAMEKIDFFLQPAPDSVVVERKADRAFRKELIEQDCSKLQRIKIDHQENDEGGIFYLFENDSRAAQLTYSMVGDDDITLDSVEVFPEYRGRGYDRELFDQITRFARERQVLIWTNGVVGVVIWGDPKYDDVIH